MIWSESLLEDTVITVHTVDDRRFSLVVSGEEHGDRDFVEKLDALRQARASLRTG